MISNSLLLHGALLLLLNLPVAPASYAQEQNALPAAEISSTKLQVALDRVIRETLDHFKEKNLSSNQLAVTAIELGDMRRPIQASYRGNIQIYPASVIKLFYLVSVHQWLEAGKLEDTDELRRAMRDMIVDSSNEATHYLVDLLTDTTSGPELSGPELDVWYHKRNVVNRFFSSLGYTNINANRKPWCEGPYGRESQSIKIHQPNHRNWLTTEATARLMMEIVTGKAVSARRSAEMMKLLERDPLSSKTSPDSQANGFTGRSLQPGERLWSKAGWTSEVRHDAAYVELSGGAKLIIVTFTSGHSAERELISTLADNLFTFARNHPRPN
jgi:hypothetical protein